MAPVDFMKIKYSGPPDHGVCSMYTARTVTVRFDLDLEEDNVIMFFHDTGDRFYFDDDENLRNVMEEDFEVVNYTMRGSTSTENDIRGLEYLSFGEIYNRFLGNKVTVFITP
jgi:hypothetical protein